VPQLASVAELVHRGFADAEVRGDFAHGEQRCFAGRWLVAEPETEPAIESPAIEPSNTPSPGSSK